MLGSCNRITFAIPSKQTLNFYYLPKHCVRRYVKFSRICCGMFSYLQRAPCVAAWLLSGSSLEKTAEVLRDIWERGRHALPVFVIKTRCRMIKTCLDLGLTGICKSPSGRLSSQVKIKAYWNKISLVFLIYLPESNIPVVTSQLWTVFEQENGVKWPEATLSGDFTSPCIAMMKHKSYKENISLLKSPEI